VKKGMTVIWVNHDSPKHNAVSETTGGPQGDLLATGEKYTFKANTVGIFDYICQLHPAMKGKLTVTE
jgi:plastocyanin